MPNVLSGLPGNVLNGLPLRIRQQFIVGNAHVTLHACTFQLRLNESRNAVSALPG
ncbi:hypothetical protein D3C84_1224040 [compost metagenome]